MLRRNKNSATSNGENGHDHEGQQQPQQRRDDVQSPHQGVPLRKSRLRRRPSSTPNNKKNANQRPRINGGTAGSGGGGGIRLFRGGGGGGAVAAGGGSGKGGGGGFISDRSVICVVITFVSLFASFMMISFSYITHLDNESNNSSSSTGGSGSGGQSHTGVGHLRATTTSAMGNAAGAAVAANSVGRLFSSHNIPLLSSWLGPSSNHIAPHPDEDPGNHNKKEDELIDMRQLAYRLPFDNPDGGVWKQGWDVEPVPLTADAPLQVYVIPHSHCDPGWLKTFDEYFRYQTKSILTTVINALLKDPRRRFIWAEISYFEWWWKDQTHDRRQQVRTLLENKQFEFVTGGWVQPDEANSELYAMEIQLQEGHDFIRRTFGQKYIPKYGWAIDPFGYSPTNAYLMKKYGFKGMLIQRVHYAVKKELAKHQQLEFYWRQTWDETTGGAHDIFTHVMPFFSYDVPHTCGPDPSVCCQFDYGRAPFGKFGTCAWHKNPQAIDDGNVQQRASLLLDQYRKKAALYRSNTVLIPLGDDFRYDNAKEAENQYTNYQKIFDYINAHVDHATVEFGTLSQYFDRVVDQFPTPVLKGSFFTYSDVNEDYWSGYFTSRVFDKALDRRLERVLFAAETLGGTAEQLQQPRRALSLFQHHDGVTGTAVNHVVEDYAQRMYDAIQFTNEWVIHTLKQNYANVIGSSSDKLQPCWASNEPREMIQNFCTGNAVVYNPLTSSQTCGSRTISGRTVEEVPLPCERPGPRTGAVINSIEFDPATGMMIRPFKEEWFIWKVRRGGAYLFIPGEMEDYLTGRDLVIEDNGYVVKTPHWKRTVIERAVPGDLVDGGGSTTATIIDFVYEIDLNYREHNNQEWFVRYTRPGLNNKGVFHTDLNGFNFDTHYFRKDMPIQSQVFPMPTLASIEDAASKTRMTVVSEHAQGTASLKDGTIDIWLDRRLNQDDARGLGQGVSDNVPTRTRLRLVLEEDYDKHYETNGYSGSSNSDDGEFRLTSLCRRMWDEIQHPLLMFGKYLRQVGDGTQQKKRKVVGHFHVQGDQAEGVTGVSRRMTNQQQHNNKDKHGGFAINDDPDVYDHGGDTSKGQQYHRPDESVREVSSTPHTVNNTVVPFVYMVYKRLDYLKEAMDSLRQSDFPRSRVPLIISHDGHVKEMQTYVESLKEEFPTLIQIFHPDACYDHPDAWPGDAKYLNVGYKGDAYGNPRSPWATCCKHHFTYILKTVFTDERLSRDGIDTFVFLEEDYIVNPTIYTAIVDGLNVMESFGQEVDGGFLGLGLDPTRGGDERIPSEVASQEWYPQSFRSGPMTLNRRFFQQLQAHASDYCQFDEYNWDWSLVHVMSTYPKLFPFTLLSSGTILAAHIGFDAGMHADQHKDKPRIYDLKPFRGGEYHRTGRPVQRISHPRGFGGWGHPTDQDHCMKLLSLAAPPAKTST